MSGTSVDGLDIAYCEFTFLNGNIDHFEILNATTVAYPDGLKTQLINAIFCDSLELTKLDIKLGQWIGNRTNEFIKGHQISPCIVASHGHTVFHQPDEGVTLQIGSGNEINRITRFPVIFDFRPMDVALGGQGAPLVPIGDKLLFSEYDCCLNIGGFANISFNERDERKAFDVCATNIVMNELTMSIGLPYDEGGQIASSGEFISALDAKLSKLDFYQLRPPKSIGKEWVENQVQPIINMFSSSELADILHTYVVHTGTIIGNSISNIMKTPGGYGNVLATGGGAYNNFLIESIKKHCPDWKITVPEDTLINYKEALVFALMGVLRVRNEINCLRSVTGASSDCSSGIIAGSLENVSLPP